jgi:hypothetical protein
VTGEPIDTDQRDSHQTITGKRTGRQVEVQPVLDRSVVKHISGDRSGVGRVVGKGIPKGRVHLLERDAGQRPDGRRFGHAHESSAKACRNL